MAANTDYATQSLQIILDNMQAIVYVTDADTYEVIFANKFLKSMFGQHVEGKPCHKALNGYDTPCPWCRFPEALKLPLGQPLVWEDNNKDLGLWFNVSQTIVRWPDGKKAHIAILSNISHIKQNEEALKAYKDELERMLAQKTESEERLQAMSDNLPNSFMFQLRDMEGQHLPELVYISKGVEAICGITSETLGSDLSPLLQHIHPNDLAHLQQAASTGKAFNVEARYKIPGTGEHRWLLFSEIPRRNRDGQTLWDGIAVNITEQKKTEEDLQRSRQELMHNAALLKEISDNMVNSAIYRSHLDEKGIVRLDFASLQMEKLVGIPVKLLLQDLSFFIKNVHPEDTESFVARIKGTTGSLAPESTEFRYLMDGMTHWYKLQSVGFCQDGRILRDGLLIDITDQKHLESQLINARNKAEESDKLKSTFMANMSHEIRTPMNAIIGFLDFLMMDDDLDRATQKEYMRIVSDNASQLLKLIGDILDISKIDAGQMRIIPEETNVDVLLNDLRASFMASGAIGSKDLELKVYGCGCDSDNTYTIDSARLRQILNNLIGNAIKFTDHGYVLFGYNVTEQGLQFFVDDTGIGISKEKIKNLGKPFQQLHDSSLAAKYGGTGIGLAISTNLVKLMGGTFSVTSEIGRGSHFEFTIPCKEISTSLPACEPHELAANEDHPLYDLTGRTLLIAEDIDNSMSYLTKLLEQCNATILTASDGEKAVEMVRKHPEIELVLMDVRMPGMNGLEATMNIKDICPDLPVIGQTAFMTQEDKDSMAVAGFDDALSKPVNRIELHEKINRYLPPKR